MKLATGKIVIQERELLNFLAPFMKNVLMPLAKNILIPLEWTAAISATNPKEKKENVWIGNDCTDNLKQIIRRCCKDN